jgi:Fe-S cluster assembly iron-binding protein IscA
VLILSNKYFNYLERKEMNINVTNKALDEIKKVLKGKNSTSKRIRIFLAGIG